MWRYLIPVALFAAVGAFFYVGLGKDPRTLPSALIGKPAPSFALPLLQDPSQKFASSDYAGDVAIVNVWGSWCYACREEHPFLLQIAKTTDVPIYGVDWNDDRDAALAWLKQLGNPYKKTGFDSKGNVAIDFGVYGAPETFLVDRKGMIVYKHVGPVTSDVWREEFLPRIEQARREAVPQPVSAPSADGHS